MANLVTSEEAKEHLRVIGSSYDAWLAVMIPAVSDAVFSWLKDPWRAYALEVDDDGNVVLDEEGVPVIAVDEDDQPIVLPRVKAAALVELSQQDRFRDGKDAGAVPSHWGHGYILGAGATSLLVGLRKATAQ